MEKKTVFVATVIILSASIGAAPFIIEETTLEKTKASFNASAQVIPESSDAGYGINADKVLNFGRMYTGSNATKYLNVSARKKAYLEVDVEGNISDVLEYEENMWIEGEKDVPIKVEAREPGYYSGKVHASFKVPKNGIGERWVNLTNSIY